MAIILGIDPGSRVTGFGLINFVQGRSEYVASGCIRLAPGPLAERLRQIYQDVFSLIEQYCPSEFAIEEVFMAKNPDSALKLGQARGAAILAAANQGIEVFEYSARKVKQSIVGRGSADKAQVQHMVQALLTLSAKPPTDAADALAIAMCHAHNQQNLIRVAGARSSRRGRIQ